MTEPLLQAHELVQEFPVRGGVLQAVTGVSLDIFPGETLSVVGETGSGKSTLARSIMQAPPPKSGTVTFQAQVVGRAAGGRRAARRGRSRLRGQPPVGLPVPYPVPARAGAVRR